MLAVLVAIVTVCGHRAHTEAVLAQTRASDQWNLYQAQKIRQYDTQLTTDLFEGLTARDPATAGKIVSGYKAHLQKWCQDLANDEKTAREQEAEVAKAERRADRFDLGEALLEIGLVVAAITLLTRQRSYWYIGMAFGVAGAPRRRSRLHGSIGANSPSPLQGRSSVRLRCLANRHPPIYHGQVWQIPDLGVRS